MKKKRTSFKIQWNIGLFIFILILAYLFIYAIIQMVSHRMSAYRVTYGPLNSTQTFEAITLKDEIIITNQTSGKIQFYAREGNRISKSGLIAGISPYTKDVEETSSDKKEKTTSIKATESDHSEDIILTSQELSQIQKSLESFTQNYHPESFGTTYDFKSELQGNIIDFINKETIATEEEKKEGTTHLEKIMAPDSGLITYQIDGLEGLTKETLTKENFSRANYQVSNARSNEILQSGNKVCKILPYDKWQLAFPLNEQKKALFQDQNYLDVIFLKDNQKAQGYFEIYEGKDGSYGIITLDSEIYRYITDRYLEIEIHLSKSSGLKIPNSSITSKEFYLVPKSYATRGGSSQRIGFLIKDSKTGEISFQNYPIYYSTQEHYYLDALAIDSKTVFVKPDSTDEFRLERTSNLEGVYNINQGYAIFKHIHVIDQNEDYSIIEVGDMYGLVEFDLIALEGKKVKESQLVR